MAIRAAFGGFIAAAILGVGAISASAAPNPGFGLHNFPVPTQGGATQTNPGPGFNFPFEQTADGPQTSNIPTLAWVGEDVRLVACDNDIVANPLDAPGVIFQQAEWNTNLWTGDQAFQATPTFDGSQSTNFYLTNTGSASFFFPTGVDNIEHGCTSADISSLHAGLDEVTLNVYQQSALGAVRVDGASNSPAGGYGLNLDPTPVYSKQFIVIWMTANAPTLSEATLASLDKPTQAGGGPASATDQLSTLGDTNVGAFVGDLASQNTFPNFDWWGTDVPWQQSKWANNTPASNNGLVDVQVTGSFPIEDAPPSTTNGNYFGGLTSMVNGQPQITLPNEWPQLASLMATSSTQNTNDNINPTGGSLWDIHGGPTNPNGHAGSATGICQHDAGPFGQTTDVVDDCVSDGAGHGNPYAFSRVFGDVTTLGYTVGPFDPLAADATLLSDGRLNTDDAPMPALPITLAIAPNSGNAGDDSGVGGLYGVAKWRVYSHDFDVDTTPGNGFGGPVALTSTGQGNLYNPFYQSYIPSTLRPIQEASGVTGVYEFGIHGGSGTDFPGFSNGLFSGSPYTYWTALNANKQATTGTNTCFRSDLDEPDGSVSGNYATPNYPNQITVYTDERGEAYIDYNPGNGWFDNGFVGDQNGACDLQSLFGKEIGSSTISAKVNYPYASVPYFPPAGANTIKKVVDSQWSKTLTAYPKNNASGGTGGANISIVVAHAQDITGQGFNDELVCFSNNAGAAMNIDTQPSVSTGTGTINLSGSAPANAPTGSSGYVCGTTNDDGNVAVEVAQSGQPAVDVLAWFTDEHLFRDVIIPVLGQSTPVSSTTPPTVLPVDKVVLQSGSGGAGGSAAGPSSTPAPGASVAPPAGGGLSVGKANSCKVNAFHMYAKKGYATLKVSCTKSTTDSVILRTYKSNGKLIHTYRKKIAAGKSVRIYMSTRKVAHVSVSV